MRKYTVIFCLFFLTTGLFAQEKYKIVIKPSYHSEVIIKVGADIKTSQPLYLIAGFDLDDKNEKLVMSLSYKSEKVSKYAGLWFPSESIHFDDINKYFERNERGLIVGTTISKQVKKGCLENNIIKTALNTRNLTHVDVPVFSKRFGNAKNDIDNQILTIENGSEMTVVFGILNNADSVIIKLNNLIPITISHASTQYFKKYQLQYVANDIEIVVLLDIDGCAESIDDIVYLDEMISFYVKHKEYLINYSKNCSNQEAFSVRKKILLSGYDDNDYLGTYRKTQCERLNNRLDSLNMIINDIRNSSCNNCANNVKELQTKYNVLDKHYQYLSVLKKTNPKTHEIIGKFEKYKKDVIKYINNSDISKYHDLECADVKNELQNVNKKITQIKSLEISQCNMSKTQAELLSEDIKQAVQDINVKANQWTATDDIQTKARIKSEIQSTISNIDEKLTALHTDCIIKYEVLNNAVSVYNKRRELCEKQGII